MKLSIQMLSVLKINNNSVILRLIAELKRLKRKNNKNYLKEIPKFKNNNKMMMLKLWNNLMIFE